MTRLVLVAVLVARIAAASPTGPSSPAPTPNALRGPPAGFALPSDAPLLASQSSTPPSDAPPATSQNSTPPSDQPGTPENPLPPFKEEKPPSGPVKVPVASSWPRNDLPVNGWDAVAAGALGVATVVVQFGVPNPSVAKWSETGFDTWVRNGLRISSQSGRDTAALTSDFFVYTLAAAPFINAFFVAGWEHERMDIAWKLAALDAQTLLTVAFVTISLQKLTARERPFVKDCQTNPTLSECSIGSKYASFPSAHTSVAFAAVALECFHHGFLDTSHTGWGAAVCPVTAVVATGTAVLRIAADRHWATDVIAGAVLGGALGYAIPALHLAFASNKEQFAVVTPAISGSYLGLSLAGRF
jgi:membrane-associated phospholipid phosphatase